MIGSVASSQTFRSGARKEGKEEEKKSNRKKKIIDFFFFFSVSFLRLLALARRTRTTKRQRFRFPHVPLLSSRSTRLEASRETEKERKARVKALFFERCFLFSERLSSNTEAHRHHQPPSSCSSVRGRLALSRAAQRGTGRRVEAARRPPPRCGAPRRREEEEEETTPRGLSRRHRTSFSVDSAAVPPSRRARFHRPLPLFPTSASAPPLAAPSPRTPPAPSRTTLPLLPKKAAAAAAARARDSSPSPWPRPAKGSRRSRSSHGGSPSATASRSLARSATCSRTRPRWKSRRGSPGSWRGCAAARGTWSRSGRRSAS